MFVQDNDEVEKKKNMFLSIALNKDSKISDLQNKIGEIIEDDGKKLLLANFSARNGMITTRFRSD